MFIYLVERTDKCGYDDYDSFVCIAEDEETALKIEPGWFTLEPAEFWSPEDSQFASWPRDVTKLKCTLIGTALPNSTRMSVCSSFNAASFYSPKFKLQKTVLRD